MEGRGRDRRIPEFKDSLVYKEKPCLREKEEGRKEEREGGREGNEVILVPFFLLQQPIIQRLQQTQLSIIFFLWFSKKATSDTKNTACCLACHIDSYSMWASCTAWTTQKEGHRENSSSHLSAIAKSQKNILTGNLPNSQQLF